MKKIILLIASALLLISCGKKPEEEVIEKPKEEVVEKKEKITTSFTAAGDNLIHGAIYLDPHYVNNNYDFTPIYSEIKPYIKDKDVAYINQETVLGGSELGFSSYPQFNSPQQIGDAIYDAGFDWINHATNHTLDVGEVGVINSLNYWDDKDVYVTGVARSEEERNKPIILEKNGVKFGLLGYTYGTNGIPVPSGKEYLVDLIDRDLIERDIKALESQVDSILVSVHWGVEYTHSYNEEQESLAQFMSDLGVDVVIGTHPHVIQPIEWKTGVNGNQTLVIYSLGNLLSAQDVNSRMLGGLANFDIVFDPNTNKKEVTNVSFMPTVNYYNKSIQNFIIYPLKDYNNDLASSHYLSGAYDMSKEYFINLVNEVMGENITLIY